jgi:hypothetical protein
MSNYIIYYIPNEFSYERFETVEALIKPVQPEARHTSMSPCDINHQWSSNDNTASHLVSSFYADSVPAVNENPFSLSDLPCRSFEAATGQVSPPAHTVICSGEALVVSLLV